MCFRLSIATILGTSMAMLSAVHLNGGQALCFFSSFFSYSVMSFYLELELVKSSARTWFYATSDTVGEEEMD